VSTQGLSARYVATDGTTGSWSSASASLPTAPPSMVASVVRQCSRTRTGSPRAPRLRAEISARRAIAETTAPELDRAFCYR
jgi:hypothetical protein